MIVDLCVYMGTWPFRHLAYAGASQIRKLMARNQVSKAVATPLQSVFYKHCTDGVIEMLQDIGQDATDLLPMAMVNPNFPGWERDLEEQIEQMNCAACGIVPNYHGYLVYDLGARQLFAKLAAMGLPAWLFVRIWDERSHHWCMQVPPLTIEDVTYVLKTFPDLSIAVCNANLPSEGLALAQSLVDRAPAVLTTAYKSLRLDMMVERIGVQHIAFASGAPFYYPESALLQIGDAPVSESERGQILCGNACRLLGLEGISAC